MYRKERDHTLFLTLDQELQLFSDKKFDSIIKAHIPLVASIAKTYRGYKLPFEDVVQEGMVGLTKAVYKFDTTKGVRLSTYAMPWIHGEIKEYVVANWKIVRVATTKPLRKLFFNLRSYKNCGKALDCSTVSTIADDLQVSETDVVMMEQRLFNHDVEVDSDTNDIIYQLTSCDTPVDDMIDDDRQMTNLLASLCRLDDRSKSILSDRWLRDDPKTLEQLSDEYGVSKERIRQIENKSLEKMKQFMGYRYE
jgi:RNA polymerase sigma-32 factor